MLVLSRRDVESLLDLAELVDAIAAAMADLSARHASMPSRVAATVPSKHAILAAMPAFLPSTQALVTKLVTLFPDNRDRPTHQAIICCFDASNGTPLAVMDGTYITAARTAAGSLLASTLLARNDAEIISILGTGAQAESHARAFHSRWPARTIRLAGRNPGRVQQLRSRLENEGIRTEMAPSFEDAVRTGDILCATTHAAEPIVRREWAKAGVHVNSVGYNSTGNGEVDGAFVRDALVVVEARTSALAEPPAGAIELRLAIEQGIVSPDFTTEIGELLLGTARGRTSDDQLTLYKSVGVAVQDAAAAALVLAAAIEQGVGEHVSI